MTTPYDFAMAGADIKEFNDPDRRRAAFVVLMAIRTYAAYIITKALEGMRPSIAWKGMKKQEILSRLFRDRVFLLGEFDEGKFTSQCSDLFMSAHRSRCTRAVTKAASFEKASQADVQRRRLIDIAERSLHDRNSPSDEDMAYVMKWVLAETKNR